MNQRFYFQCTIKEEGIFPYTKRLLLKQYHLVSGNNKSDSCLETH